MAEDNQIQDSEPIHPDFLMDMLKPVSNADPASLRAEDLYQDYQRWYESAS